MRTLQEKYNAIKEGNFSKAQFLRDARMSQPQLITQYNGFDDAVQILKNRGMIAEAKMQEPKYSSAKPEDKIAPDVLDTGIKFELDKKFGTLDVSEEDFKKAKETATKNLAKDVLYYVKQDSIQLDTPKEKMEKVKLNEEVDSKAIVAKMIPIIQDYLAAGGDRGAAKGVMDDLKNGRNLNVYADIQNVEDLEAQLDYEGSYQDDFSDLEEDHSANPNDKYEVKPCDKKDEPWAVWEGEVRVKGFATKEEAQEFADKQNKEQGLTEGDYEPRTKEDLVYQYLRDAWQLGATKGKEFNPDEELSIMADSLITYLPDYDVAEYKAPKYSEEELAQITKDQQEHDEEQLRRERGLEEQQLKELFKKIITKVITE